MSRTLCRVFGVALVLAGLAGFADPSLFGLHLTAIHNLIHAFSGLVLLYVGFAGSEDAIRGLMLTFGSVYVLMGLLGFLAPGLVQALIGHPGSLDASALAPDNILHVLLGTVLVFTSLAHSPGEVPPVARPHVS
ncbi:MAG: hypothetical protein ACHP85_06975 [Burkholderiales bacterium]|jgi:uncharacterized membrane protein